MKLTWSIREPFHLAWTNELLALDTGSDESASTAASVSNGLKSFPAQYDPARKALLAVVDIPADAKFVLTPATTAVPSAQSLRKSAGSFVVSNEFLSVAFPAEPSVEDAGDSWLITGPLSWIQGPDRTPRGASNVRIPKSAFFPHDQRAITRAQPEKGLAAGTPPKVSTRVTHKGPVFIRWEYKIQIKGRGRYLFTATVYHRRPCVMISEETSLGLDGSLNVTLNSGFPCDEYFFGGTHGSLPQRSVPLPQTPYRIGSLTPHHTQGHTAYPWIGFVRSQAPQSAFRGICDTEVVSAKDAIVVMGHKPWEWDYPSENAPNLEVQSGGQVLLSGPIARGRRGWCLFMFDRKDAITSGGPLQAGTVQSPIAVWHRRINDAPFDWIRGLDLDSGIRPSKKPGSALLGSPAAVADWAAHRKPALAAILEPSLRETKSEDALFLLWILKKDRKALRSLADMALAYMEGKLKLVHSSGFLSDNVSAVMARHLGPTAVYFEEIVQAGILTSEERVRLQRQLLFFAYATATDAMFPSHHNYHEPDHPRSIRNWAIREQYSDLFGTPNFQTDVYINLGLFGAVFRKHPRASEWLAEAARQMDQQLDFHFHHGGVYEESPGYFVHVLHGMVCLASVLRRHAGRDFYADPRFQAALETFVDYLGAPRRATLEGETPQNGDTPAARRRFIPSIGDTGSICIEAGLHPLVLAAATEIGDMNPRLSDKLRAAWQECCNGALLGGYPPSFDALYMSPEPATTTAFRPAARRFHGAGHMFRADEGLPSETSLFLRSGTASHHWGFDHGHFTMVSRGSQLVPDYGYYGSEGPKGPKVMGYSAWLHNAVTFGPLNPGYMGIEHRLPERIVSVDEDFAFVVVDITSAYAVDSNWRNFLPIQPVRYYRYFLFAPNRYVFIWDRIDHSIYPSQLRINCLARSMSVDGPRIRFKGLDDVDLVVTMATPREFACEEGLVANQRYALIRQECERDYIWVAQPVGPGEREFDVLAQPNRVEIRGRDLHGREFSDTLLYNKRAAPLDIGINRQQWQLDGHFALVRKQDGRETTRLFDARSLQAR